MTIKIYDPAPAGADGKNMFAGNNVGNTTLSPGGGASTLASDNVAFGFGSLYSLTTGYKNIAIGKDTLSLTNSGSRNTAVGNSTLTSNTTGEANAAFGSLTLYANVSGYGNTGVGCSVLPQSTGDYNTAVGLEAGYTDVSANANTSGNRNTWVGAQSGPSVPTPISGSLALGFRAYNDKSDQAVLGGAGITETVLRGNVLADTINGLKPRVVTPAGSDGGNVFAGQNVGNTTLSPGGGAANLASDNVALGKDALYSLTTGYGNVAIGTAALGFNTTGFYNIGIGRAALAKNTTGNNNVGIGTSALYENLTGGHNTALGLQAQHKNTTGSHNTSIGRDSGFSNTTGNWNTNLGVDAGPGTSTGSGNTFVGGESGYGENSSTNQNLTGSNNTQIGYQCSNEGDLQNLDGCVAVGYRAKNNKSNQAVFGGENITETVLRGTVIIDGTPITGAQVAALLALLPPSA